MDKQKVLAKSIMNVESIAVALLGQKGHQKLGVIFRGSIEPSENPVNLLISALKSQRCFFFCGCPKVLYVIHMTTVLEEKNGSSLGE